MINSLSKDSHITLGTSYTKRSPMQKSVCQNSVNSALVCKSGINNVKPGEPSFCGFFNADKFYKSSLLKKTLKFADDQQLVFGASFALLLTCVMRPASIMLFPSKKNKDDQKYASAHSIASGVIGFAISTAVFTPISSGIKKFTKAPAEFLKDSSHYLLKDEKALNTAKIYLDRLPDLVTAIPKGLLTIALIPPILKHVFGMQKKSASANGKSTNLPVDYSLLNFKNSMKNNQGVIANFNGGSK